MTQASYVVQSRQNSNLQLAGIIDDYASLAMILRFNNFSEWTMSIPRQSAHLPNLVPVGNALGALGNGIIVTRDFGTGPQVILSGPITHLDYQMKSQLVVLKGYDDSIWLKWRRADTVPASYPFATEALADAPQRYYKCGESSGTVVNDSSTHASAGTYVGGVTLAQAALIDSLETSALLNGTTGYVSANSGTGLNTGNLAWTMYGWFYPTGLPGVGGAMNALGYGKSPATSKATVSLYVDHAGLPHIFCSGASDVAGTTVMTTGIPHFFCLTYDGTNLVGYLDGQPFATENPATLAIVISNINWGADATNASPWIGRVGHGVFVNAALTPARILTLYNVGRSRLADAVSDNRAGQASTVMLAYVNVNAGPGTLVKRQVANLSLAADPALGGQVTGVARCDELLTILQGLALQSGDNVGFKIQQTYLAGPNTLSCSIYAPTDRTTTALFSAAPDGIGNLLDYSYSVDFPAANAIEMGGAGGGISRAFLEGSDSGSVSTYGRIEGFVNGAASNDYLTMLNGISAQLLQNAAQTNLSITPIDTAGLQYQRDYNLGDKATVVVEGQTIQDKIREIRINLTKGSGANSPDEVITPALGQQALAAASDSLIASALRELTRNIQRANKRIAIIEQNQ